MSNRIAILLTVHNRKLKTLHCLKNVYECKVPQDTSFDIYITDDGCTDGTAEAIRAQYTKVNIVQGDGSLFWNRGMYAAWKEASKLNYDYYLWLNDDTYIYDTLFAVLLNVAANMNDNGIVVGAVCIPETKHFAYGGRLLNGHAVEPGGKAKDVDLANGNILLIPRKVYEVVGNLDSYYRHDKGDSDYSLMVKEKGFRIVQTPRYVGECSRHITIPKWMNPNESLLSRWKSLYSVMGPNPKEVFYFERKHFGVYKAIKKVLATYLRCVCPKFFVWTGKEKQLYVIQVD